MHYGPYATLSLILAAGFLYSFHATAHEVPADGDLGTLFLTDTAVRPPTSDLVCGKEPTYNMSSEAPEAGEAYAARSLVLIGCQTGFEYVSPITTVLGNSTLNTTVGCFIGVQGGSLLDMAEAKLFVNGTEVGSDTVRNNAFVCTGSSKLKLDFEFASDGEIVNTSDTIRLEVTLKVTNTEQEILEDYYYFVGGDDASHFHPGVAEGAGPGTGGTSGTSGGTSGGTNGTTGGTTGSTEPTPNGTATPTDTSTGTATATPTSPTTTGPHCNLPPSNSIAPTSGSSSSGAYSSPPPTSSSSSSASAPPPTSSGTASPTQTTSTSRPPCSTSPTPSGTGRPSPSGTQGTGTSPASPSTSECACHDSRSAAQNKAVKGAGSPGLGAVPLLVVLAGLGLAIAQLRRRAP